MILGVTGGIASGKSTVTRIFEKLGAAVISADELSRETTRKGSAVLERLVERFGPGVLTPEGTLDRPALARQIFADEKAREDLMRITHPAIGELAEKRLAELVRSGAPLVVYEAPLLFEAGAEKRVDAVLVVTVAEHLQLQRLMERDRIGREEARSKIGSQMQQEEKVARADFLIDNSDSLETTEARVRRLFQRLTCSPAG